MSDMLQKTENVANNVANEKSQDLTEQMHKGELPEGWYYVIKTGDVEMLEYSCNCFLAVDVPLIDNEVTEVLAPVPSYEEWKAKDVALTYLLAEYGRLTKELQDEKEKHITRPSLRSPEDEMVIEKQVWESTLNRSMNLQAENEELKEILERHKKATAKAQIRSCDLEIINSQLKELLKECRSPINYALCLNLSEEEKIEFKNLLAKINEVLNA